MLSIRLTRLVLAAPFALLLLAGCGKQELYSQLSERSANEMVAVLRGAGIDAEKQVKDGQFSIATASGDFAAAVRTLSSQGYPRESYDTMGKVFKREGFVSTPLEERARLLHAMSQEISNTLANIDGVVTARVHLVVPEKNPLMDKVLPSAAAVFIKHRPDRNLSGQVTQIKALVVNSIEGLAYDNVTVALFPAENIPAEGTRAPAAPTAAIPTARRAEAGSPFGMPLMAGTLVGVLALGGAGLMWLRRRGAPADHGAPALTHEADTPRAGDDLNALLRRVAGHK
jgi:type III secretion protein J